jgi:hypothetical protein
MKIKEKIKLHSWSRDSFAFWERYGITENILKEYNVHSVKSIKYKPEANEISFDSSQNVFAYWVSNECFKVYQPESRKMKFSWLGLKPKEYVFGFDQLPDEGEVIFIAAGEKDVLSLKAMGYASICFNSETYIPSAEFILSLKKRFKRVVIVYDSDETGMKQSEKLSSQFGVLRVLLDPDILDGGKDISDMVLAGNAEFFEEMKTELVPPNIDDLLFVPMLLETKERISLLKDQHIKFEGPAVTIQESPVLFLNTINIIQGKTGTHKSRFAELLVSTILKSQFDSEQLLGLCKKKEMDVLFIDTERNLTDQFPYSIQQMLKHGGYEVSENPTCLDYTSFVNVAREDRFKALQEHISYKRRISTGHLLIVLDVVSDFVSDFNSVENSMNLTDLLNNWVNKFDVTFICIIHENPGDTEKARGHLGTELSNKSSTVIQIGFEKGKNKRPTNILSIKCLKNRKAAKFKDVFTYYDDSTKRLEIASEEMLKVEGVIIGPKAPVGEMIPILGNKLVGEIPSKILIPMLQKEFSCSDKLIKERLNHIMEGGLPITNDLRNPLYLYNRKDGNQVIYYLSQKE